jgi:cobalt-zinc-cadmium efflux system outer membrane protein
MNLRRGARLCALVVCLGRVSRAHAQPGNELTLQAAFDRALAGNPAIAAARLFAGVHRAGVALARERPYPEARLELERETPTRSYGFAVPIELGGKRSRRIALSEAVVQTGEAELARTIVDVRADVRRVYFEAVIAGARLTLLDELHGIAVRGRDAAQQRFDAGSAPRLEILQAQLALSQAENETAAASAAVEAARTRLNALLGLPLDAAAVLSTPPDPQPITTDRAIARAQASNAELAVLERRLAEQRVRVAFARSLQVPDLIPEGTITRGAEPEFSTGWRAAVGIGIPLFSRHRAGVLVEETTLTQLTAERAAALARISGEVGSAAALVEAQRQQYLRYRDEILPQALEVERMAEDAYRLGQSGITALLQALQVTRDVRLRALQVASELQGTVTDLERAIGEPIQ